MIPNKSTFKFQELTPITGVKPYVIRFWETEFEEISPVNSDSGQKLYARKDVEAILKIKKLLFEEKLSVQEAKLKMGHGDDVTAAPQVEAAPARDFSEVRKTLNEAIELIKDIKARHNW